MQTSFLPSGLRSFAHQILFSSIPTASYGLSLVRKLSVIYVTVCTGGGSQPQRLLRTNVTLLSDVRIELKRPSRRSDAYLNQIGNQSSIGVHPLSIFQRRHILFALLHSD